LAQAGIRGFQRLENRRDLSPREPHSAFRSLPTPPKSVEFSVFEEFVLIKRATSAME
jgi:hypothetical protein